MTKTSPLPWHVDSRASRLVSIQTEANDRVALISDPASSVSISNLGTRMANAALIVRAVNSHQQLVDAFTAIVAVLDGRQPKDPAGALMVAKSALAAANS